jgi:MFS family permease
LRYGLDFSSFSGLNQLLDGYRANDSDLSYVSLTQGNAILVESGLAGSAGSWHTPTGTLESTAQVGATSAARTLMVHLGTSRLAIVRKLYESIKNFSALFIASILIATVLHRFGRTALSRAAAARRAEVDHLLGLIVPLYFVAVFADSLNNSFLPQHFQAAVVAVHASSGLVSFMFTAWYLAYALALFPSGLLAERYGFQPLFIGGALLTTTSLAILASTSTYPLFYVTQFMDGLGQGMIFIGVQSYILRLTSASKRTQGVGIVVFGFNGGLIAGNAMGSLLAVDPAFGERGVFLTGSVLSALLVLYTVRVIPKRLEQPLFATVPPTERALPGAGVGMLLRDRIFCGTAFLVGVPTKIVMAGVMAASLPLVLERAHYQTQDIGQLLMLYSCGVLISSRFLSRLADRRGNTRAILMAGLLGTAVGLGLTGVLGWPLFAPGSLAASFAVIIGLSVLGLAHGCIQAPSLTHAASSEAAHRYGAAAALSFYRLLERIGNISGPLVVGGLLVAFHQSAVALSVLGVFFVLLLALFGVVVRSPVPSSMVASLQPAG